MIAGLALRDTAPVGHFTSAAAKARFVATYDAAMTELPRPEATLDLRTGFGIVRVYRFAGTGSAADATPLVLLPGRSSGTPVWADNLPGLRALGPVYSIDLLGEPGLSIQDRPISSDADSAQWLHEVIEQLPEPQLHLVGMSIGGWTAINLAVHQPAKIASISLIDGVLVFSDLSPAVVVRSLPASLRWLPKSWRDDFASWTANGAPVEDVPVAQMIEAGMQGYVIRLSPPSRISTDRVRELDLPVLAIVAGASRMHDGARTAEVARTTLSHGTVHLYDGASHALSGEQPDRIAADVGRFLATVR